MAQVKTASDAQVRPGFYYGWVIVGLSVLTQMMGVALVINCFSLFLPDWSREFHSPVSTFQVAMTVFAVVATPFCALAGWLADRYSMRRLLPLGLLLVAAAQVAIGLSGAAWMVVAIYVLVGISVPLASNITSQAMVARWFIRRRGLALGISALGNATGAMIFPPVVGILMHNFGWRATWLSFSAGIVLVVVPILLLLVRDRPEPDDRSGYMVGAELQEVEGAPSLTYRQIVFRANFWLIGLPSVFVFALYMALLANLTPLVKSHGFSVQSAVVLLSSYAIFDVIGKLVSGASTDRFGARLPMAVVCGVGAVAAAGLAFAPGGALMVASLMAIGLVGGIWAVTAAAVANEFGRSDFGRAYGLINAFTPAGTLAPWFLARTQELTGAYTTGLLGLGALSLVGMILALLIRERRA
jgi:MFS family permease